MAENKKTVFITGCSAPGIGHQLAQVFHERGFRVFATARKAESLAELKAKGIETLSLVVDDEESVKACYADLVQRLDGRGLDFLVNNAGRNYTVPATDLDISEVEHTFRVNVFAVMRINQLFFPLLQKVHGTIVHIGSVAAIMPFAFGSAYNASKAALHSYCNTLRVELAPFGVHVLTIVTGGVKSNIARTKRDLPADSVWKGEEAAYQRRQVMSQTQGQETRTYAEDVVKAATTAKGWLWNRNQAWLGGKAGLIWTVESIDWWTPGGLWQRVAGRMFGVPKKMEMEGKKRV